MSDIERRRSKRRTAAFAVSVVTETMRLEGELINISPRGALLRASGRIAVQLDLEGTVHRGLLVRAHPLGDGAIAYAIKLDDT